MTFCPHLSVSYRQLVDPAVAGAASVAVMTSMQQHGMVPMHSTLNQLPQQPRWKNSKRHLVVEVSVTDQHLKQHKHQHSHIWRVPRAWPAHSTEDASANEGVRTLVQMKVVGAHGGILLTYCCTVTHCLLALLHMKSLS